MFQENAFLVYIMSDNLNMPGDNFLWRNLFINFVLYSFWEDSILEIGEF